MSNSRTTPMRSLEESIVLDDRRVAYLKIRWWMSRYAVELDPHQIAALVGLFVPTALVEVEHGERERLDVSDEVDDLAGQVDPPVDLDLVAPTGCTVCGGLNTSPDVVIHAQTVNVTVVE